MEIYKTILSILAAACTTAGLTCAYAQGPDEIMESIAGSRNFEGASISAIAVTGGGDTLLCYDSDRLLLPASNMKLVTTALALHSLGPDYRYETGIGYSGKIESGTLKGDLYIIGGGDPTTGSSNSIALPLDSLFGMWAGFIAGAGITRIEGHITGDGSWFSGMDEHPTWELCDAGTYYGTGTSGLSFYENVQDFRVAAGQKPGDPLDIKPVYPASPWMKFIYSCSTGKAGTGNTLYFYPDSFSPVGEMRGTFAVDRKPKTESASNKFPEYTVAWYFWKFLEEKGVKCTEGPADRGPVFGTGRQPSGITMIGSTVSPSLAEIAGVTNRDSNNLYAETLMKTLGKEYCGSGCYDSAYVAVNGLLDELGVKGHRFSIKDGSGLSRENLVSAGFMCDLLLQMMQSPSFEDFFNSLPYPGGQGTLEFNMRSVPASVKTRIHMKSGTMGGVRCFSGYITPESGSKEDSVIFSILVNGFTTQLSIIQSGIDRIILSLARCSQH